MKRVCLAALLALALSAGVARAATDPAGDTLGIASPQLDVLALDGELSASALHLVLAFDQPPAVAVGGLVDLDVDADATSGAPSYVSFLCPAESELGVERRVDLFTTDAQGRAAILDEAWQPVGQASVLTSGATVEVIVPRHLLAGSLAVRAAAVVGPAATEVTDCVPDGGSLTIAGGPAPPAVPGLHGVGAAALAMLLAMAALLMLRR